MSAWDNYDNWLLQGSGVDDDTPEVFETEKHKLFSCNEDTVRKFDDEIEKVKYLVYDTNSYADYGEFFEECKYNLVDELGLHDDENDAINELSEKYQDEKEAAAEQKMQARKDGEW